MKTLQEPAQIGWRSVKANAVPMLVLWTMAGALVAGYYCWSGVHSVLEVLGCFQASYGLWAGFVSQFVFCGVIPCLFRLTVTDIKTEHPVLKSFLQSLWCGCWGFVYVGFYALQSVLFGTGTGLGTLAAKMAFDQFVWTPLVPVPLTAFFCFWMECGFSLRRAGVKFRADFLRQIWLANLLPNWLIWIPAVLAIYAFPQVLQVQVLGLVGSFWALVSLKLAKEVSD